jgi:hypothetical protein
MPTGTRTASHRQENKMVIEIEIEIEIETEIALLTLMTLSSMGQVLPPQP